MDLISCGENPPSLGEGGHRAGIVLSGNEMAPGPAGAHVTQGTG